MAKMVTFHIYNEIYVTIKSVKVNLFIYQFANVSVNSLVIYCF